MEKKTMIQYAEVSENQIVIVFDDRGREFVITEDTFNALMILVKGGK